MNTQNTQRYLKGKRLVVFGSGFVGGAVAARALKLGADVTVLTRNQRKATNLEELGCRSIVADLADTSWHGKISVPDFLLNSVSSGRDGIEGYRRSYYQGTQSILNWSERAGGSSSRLIYTGSTSVYPQGEGREVDESCEVGGTDERIKLLLETENMVRSMPGRTSILRLAGIYGPGRHYLLNQIRNEENCLSGKGDYFLNLVYLEDIVSAIFAVWEAPNAGTHSLYNVVDDGSYTKGEIVRWLAQKLHKPEPEFSGKSLTGRRAKRPNRRILNSKLKHETGWSPAFPSFREGYSAILDA